MRAFRLFLLLAALAFLFFPVIALAHDIPHDKLIGSWIGTDAYATGAAVETRLSVNADGTFAGTATVNHKPFWSFSGTWILVGHDLTWTYAASSPALPNAAKEDVDEVVSVSEDELVLKSSLTGEERVFKHSPAVAGDG